MKTIVIATDFSASSIHAAKYAAKLVKPLGINAIVVYHSYDNTPMATEVPVKEQSAALIHEGSLLALEVVEREIRPILMDTDISISLVANDQSVLLGIQSIAEQHNAELIVIGSTGKSNFEQILIGSNAVNLASDISFPLLIVPKNAQFDSIDKIVFACDLKQVSRNTPVAEIGLWLEKLDARLVVLNVSLEGKRFDLDTIPEQYKLHHLLDGFNPDYHYTEGKDIAEEIEDFAKEESAGLIITIPKSYGFFEGLFRRSVSKKLIKESDVPLLLLKEKES